jgi:hypothetical protein
MRTRHVLPLAAVLLLATSAAAMAAVKLKPHTAFFFVEFGRFSISLDSKSAKQIDAGIADPVGNQHPVSGVLVVCPSQTPGGPVTELHVGFPGATLKLAGRHYGFTRSYTEAGARLVALGPGGSTTRESAKVEVTGTVIGAKLITGTVAVTAPGCNLRSSKYRAKLLSSLPA